MKKKDSENIEDNVGQTTVLNNVLTTSNNTNGFVTVTSGLVTTSTSTNITIGSSGTGTGFISSGSGGYTLEVQGHIDLKSLIVDKKIKLNSLSRDGSCDFYEIKKIKLKSKGTELQCERKISTIDIEEINSKKVLLSEIIDGVSVQDFRKNAIKYEESLINYNGFGTFGLNENFIYNNVLNLNVNSTSITTSNINLVSGMNCVTYSYC